MLAKLVRTCLAVALASSLHACKRAPRDLPPPKVPATVSAFTGGTVSREAPIRVEFATKPLGSIQVGTPLAASPFKTSPSFDGVAVWAKAQTLELRPKAPLQSGETYTVELPLDGLVAEARKTDVLSFGFTVMPQSFAVDVPGLEAADDKGELLQCRGTLTSADVADTADVEALVKARLDGKEVALAWKHEADRLHHAFVAKGLKRTDRPRAFDLAWDGKPIGSATRGRFTAEVPALGAFAVLSARSSVTREPMIEIRFSDALEARQDLAGLVKVGANRPRLSIEGSVLRAFDVGAPGETAEVTIEPGIESAGGKKLEKKTTAKVSFPALKPLVRFGSKGAILPTSQGLTVPIEVVNVRRVTVEAMRIRAQNVPQFLQVNDLDESKEIYRVGRVVWSKVFELGLGADARGRVERYGLDLGPLVAANPGGIYRLRVSFKPDDADLICPSGPPALPEQAKKVDEHGVPVETTIWDGWGQSDNVSWEARSNKDNPCHAGYYQVGENAAATRTVFITDIGLIAKSGTDRSLLVVATDLKTSKPLSGAKIEVLDFQQQTIAEAKTDGDGTARVTLDHRPFLVVATAGGQTSYLKLDAGSALPVSHFDVGGTALTQGIKGVLYGERGVWRPGDKIHLTFVLFDPGDQFPADHPVQLELLDPQGRVVDRQTRTESVDDIYTFPTETRPGALTGNYTARVTVGGATFTETLKVETVRPNRLKISVDFPGKVLTAGKPLTGKLSSSWLTGVPAQFLTADVRLSLERRRTDFERFSDHEFNDVARRFEPESFPIFEGALDGEGKAAIKTTLKPASDAAGLLTASFSTRVFESSGAYSTDTFSMPFSPYPRYIGIRTPKGDAARNMLLTDTEHEVSLVAVDAEGAPVKGDVTVDVQIYKIGWRWWWEKGEDTSPADFVRNRVAEPIRSGKVNLKDGKGSWSFEIKYPDWGRYLILADDAKGGHRSGKVIYVDWPGWAGRAQKDMPGGANVLSFAADKKEYQVGETVTLTIPTPQAGRALLSLETGSKVLEAEWLEAKGSETRATFKATSEMAPTIYAHVTLVQPHLQSQNDAPIRLYGVIPLKVVDPATKLAPVIDCAEVFEPEKPAKIQVKEKNGRAMSYTVAVVDEGLLGLTRYSPPDLWSRFYQREALGVRTWDFYDAVAGAYGASLERLLAIGGDDYEAFEPPPVGGEKTDRFPPMVRFVGPFTLGAGKTGEHAIDVPRYVGAVRVMVVAAHDRGFGAAEKSVFVRRPLMVVSTLPRVLGPEEEVAMPVTVFALEDKVKSATVTVKVQGPIEIVGEKTLTLTFQQPGDRTVPFRLKAKAAVGEARIDVRAEGGGEQAAETTHLAIRMPGVPLTSFVAGTIDAGESWDDTLELPGMPGTNKTTLELSRVPPVDLSRRLDSLVQYPHGCIEQTTSSVFPQLYLSALTELSDERKKQIETNIRAGIERLQTFQVASGGFSYWPGSGEADDWGSSYAGHFLVEAKKAGYLVPEAVLEQWQRFQKKRTDAWSRAPGDAEADLPAAPVEAAAAESVAEPAPDTTTEDEVEGDGENENENEEGDVPSFPEESADSYSPYGGEPAEEPVETEPPDVPLAATRLGSELNETYRLYTLALAGVADLGAMNRLKEAGGLSTAATWRLAAAYAVAGKPEIAKAMTAKATVQVATYRALAETYGSDLRDRAMILEALELLGQHQRAKSLFDDISKRLTGEEWLSTQEIAYSLIALKSFAKATSDEEASTFSYTVNGKGEPGRTARSTVTLVPVEIGKATTATAHVENRGKAPLFVRLIGTGLPKYGEEKGGDNGLELRIAYKTMKGEDMSPHGIAQGSDFVTEVTVANTSDRRLDNLALSQLVAAGWEIRNIRVEGGVAAKQSAFDHQDIRDDRIYTYFELQPGQTKTFHTVLNASYVGRFYLPVSTVVAMYDETISGLFSGAPFGEAGWITVEPPGTKTAAR